MQHQDTRRSNKQARVRPVDMSGVDAFQTGSNFADVESPEIRSLLLQIAQGPPARTSSAARQLSPESLARQPGPSRQSKTPQKPQKSPGASRNNNNNNYHHNNGGPSSSRGPSFDPNRVYVFENSKMPSTSKYGFDPSLKNIWASPKQKPSRATSVAQRFQHTGPQQPDPYQDYFPTNTADLIPFYNTGVKFAHSPRTKSQNASTSSGPPIPEEVLDDLCFRFLNNLPPDEQTNQVRICFQIELAFWMYLDIYCKDRADCHTLGMKEFSKQMFANCDFLKAFARDVDRVVDEWRQYKSAVPTYGAILLDSSLNYVLLVQGYYSKNSWGFPKGKINEGEEPRACAMREVHEETGYDFGIDRPNGTEKKLQKFIGDTMVRLYIIPDVPADYPFAPMTKKEIRKIQWFKIWDLPQDKWDNKATATSSNSSSRFYTVYPFVSELQQWVKKEQARRAKAATKAPKQPQGKSPVVRTKDRSAFTPVVPKSVNEKMNSAMELIHQDLSPTTSTPRSDDERRKITPSDSLFRPVGNEPKGLTGSAFMHIFSTAPPPAVQQPQNLAQPVPLTPKLNTPVYTAPKEEIVQKKKTKRVKSDSQTPAPATAGEMEQELMRLLGKDLAGEMIGSAGPSSPETIGKGDDEDFDDEEDDDADSVQSVASSTSALMIQDVPLTSQIIAAEAAERRMSEAQNVAVIEEMVLSGLHQPTHQERASLTDAHSAYMQRKSLTALDKAPGSAPRSRRVSHVSQMSSFNESPQNLPGTPPVFDWSAATPSTSTAHGPVSDASTHSSQHFTPISVYDLFQQHPQRNPIRPEPGSWHPSTTTTTGFKWSPRSHHLAQAELRAAPILPAVEVQLCEAWKDFKLDSNAILSGLPGAS